MCQINIFFEIFRYYLLTFLLRECTFSASATSLPLSIEFRLRNSRAERSLSATLSLCASAHFILFTLYEKLYFSYKVKRTVWLLFFLEKVFLSYGV